MGAGHTSPTVAESPIGADPSVALSTGYAQSKYIGTPLLPLFLASGITDNQPVERITKQATKTLAINIKLLRVGQLCGHTKTGYWSTSEMWPILFATSAHPDIHALPRFEKKSVDWIPVNIAASTIYDILLSSTSTPKGEYNVHNITNPHPIPWSSLLCMLQPSLSSHLEIVSMREWVSRLNGLADRGVDAKDVPGLRLLQFFENMANDDDEESKVYETEKTRAVSGSLRECGAFCGEWIDGNMRVWREMRFLC
jgi:thioester reductase-like protein